ncbi:hypothetical protein V5P93_003907 [Actinokineospora auranticolor]|nr:hypothetical protein [Actinokineospora auranticolor]
MLAAVRNRGQGARPIELPAHGLVEATLPRAVNGPGRQPTG